MRAKLNEHLVASGKNKKGRKQEGKECHAKLRFAEKMIDKALNKHPACAALAERGGKRTREGAKSGVGHPRKKINVIEIVLL